MKKKTSVTHTQTVIAAGRSYLCEFSRTRQGGYLVTCRHFLPLAAYGDTLDAARKKAQEAIEAWISHADCREFA
jgi:predicted RNase H-like HicB family nuclease